MVAKVDDPKLRAGKAGTSPDTVAVFRFSSIGDIVLTAPAVEALKAAWPETHLVFVTKAGMADLVAHNPNVDSVESLAPGEGPRALAQRLEARGVEAILDLHGKIRSRLLRAMVGARRTAVWKRRALSDSLMVPLRLRPYRATMRIAERYHAAAEQLVGRDLPAGALRYWVGDDNQREADERLGAIDVPLLGMAPGAMWATKRWPVERFRAVAERAQAAGMRVVIVGSADDTPLAEQIPDALDLTGKIPLRLLGGVLARCAAFVANDTGPMHIARALDVPTIALFGSTDPAQFDWNGHAYLFREELSCAPCSFYGRPRCPQGHFKCMLDIEPPDVSAQLERLLAGPPAPKA